MTEEERADFLRRLLAAGADPSLLQHGANRAIRAVMPAKDASLLLLDELAAALMKPSAPRHRPPRISPLARDVVKSILEEGRDKEMVIEVAISGSRLNAKDQAALRSLVNCYLNRAKDKN